MQSGQNRFLLGTNIADWSFSRRIYSSLTNLSALQGWRHFEMQFRELPKWLFYLCRSALRRTLQRTWTAQIPRLSLYTSILQSFKLKSVFLVSEWPDIWRERRQLLGLLDYVKNHNWDYLNETWLLVIFTPLFYSFFPTLNIFYVCSTSNTWAIDENNSVK